MSAPNAFLAASKPVRMARSSARSTNSGVGQPVLAEASRDLLDVDGPDLLDGLRRACRRSAWRSASRMRCSSSLDFAERPGRTRVGRQRLRQRHQPLHRPGAALRQRLRRQRRPQLPHLGRHVRVGQSSLPSMTAFFSPPGMASRSPGEEPDDVPGGGAVEERQDAVDGVEPLVAGDAAGERVADHAARAAA